MINYLLFWSTTIVNVTCLAIALCLGLYIVTRTPRGWKTWLAGLMLWSMAAFYLYNSLALAVPANRVLLWLRPSVILALAFGFHLSLLLPVTRREIGFRPHLPPLLIPHWLERRLARAAPVIRRIPVPLSYALALALIALGAIPVGQPVRPADGPAFYLSDRSPSPLYPLAIVYLILLFSLAFVHYWQVWRGEAHRLITRPVLALLVALVLTLCGGVYLGLGVWLQADLPTLPGDVAVGMAAIVLGYQVAEHNSNRAGLVLRRELAYMSALIGMFTVGYVLVAELLHQGGHIFSALTLILIVIVGVTSLMLYDGARSGLDRLFYREQFRHLRSNLRALAREAGVGQPLPVRLQSVLTNVCGSLRIRRGFVALRKGDGFECQAAERTQCLGQTYPLAALEATEIVELPRPGVESAEGMLLLVPVYAADAQIGALVLGRKENDAPYTEEDLFVLEDVADQLGTLISTVQRQEAHARAISQMVSEFREGEHTLQRQMHQMLAAPQEEPPGGVRDVDGAFFAELVEDALRRLHDFTYLGEHALAQMKVVECYLPAGDKGFVTHIDRGKAVGSALVESISKLRPAAKEPAAYSVPSRAWHQYFILHDAYVLGDPNRDIMSKLYISEGTFNRTRRRALRGVAKALQEMEQEASLRNAH